MVIDGIIGEDSLTDIWIFVFLAKCAMKCNAFAADAGHCE